MKKTLNSVLGVVLVSILFILLGIVLIIWPDIAGKIVCYSLGVLILIFAAFRIVSFFTDKKVYFMFNLDLVVGLVAAGVGVYMLISPETVITVLPFMVGLLILFSSILDLQKALMLRNYGNPRWKSSLVLTFVKMALGIFMLAAPFLLAMAFIQVIGIALIYNGLSELWIVSRWPKTDEHF